MKEDVIIDVEKDKDGVYKPVAVNKMKVAHHSVKRKIKYRPIDEFMYGVEEGLLFLKYLDNYIIKRWGF